MLREILDDIQAAREGSLTTIPDSQVRRWMSTSDPEALGAIYVLLTDAKLSQTITPPLPFDEVFAFLLRYFEFCLRNDPQGEWVDNRFTAGSDFVSAFVSFWDARRESKYFREMKSLLSRLYIEGSGELKDSIEQAIVEHLFERKDIRQFFADWQDDPQLRSAYEAGKLWADGGGKSPLTESRRK